MNIAVITYDEDLKNKLISLLPQYKIKGYIDSISMLKDLDNFNPYLIVYDASTGDFAQEDLKFLMSRDKVKDRIFKVLYSKVNPINIEELEKSVTKISFYDKEEELNKLLEDIQNELQATDNNIPGNVEENSEPSSFTSPEDIENFYSKQENNEEVPEFDEMFMNPSLEELQNSNEEESFPLVEELDTNMIDNEFLTSEPYNTEETNKPEFEIEETNKNNLNEIKKPQNTTSVINISIDKAEIERKIINIAAEKLVETLKEDPEIKEITDSISKDFIEKINEEIDHLKEEIKKEFKENLSKRLEEEINSIIKQELKDYIAQITTKIVEEKLSQIFKK